MKSKLFLYFLIFTAVLLGAIKLLSSAPVIAYFSDQLTRTIQNKTGIQFTFDELKIDPLALSISVKNLQIQDKNQHPFVGVNEVKVRFSVWAFIFDDVPITHVEVDKPLIYVDFYDGKFNGWEWATGQEPLGSIRHRIKKIRVNNAQVRARIENKWLDIPQFSVSAYKLKDHLKMQFWAEDIVFRSPQWVQQVESIEMALSLPFDRLFELPYVRLDSSAIHSSQGELFAFGNFEFLETPRKWGASLYIDAHTNLAQLVKPFQLSTVIAGEMGLKGYFRLTDYFTDWRYEGEAHVSHIEVGDLLFEGVRGHVEMDAGGLQLTPGVVELGGVPIDVEAKFAWDKNVHYEVEAKALNFSLYELLYSIGVRYSWTELLIDTHAKGSGTLLPEFVFSGTASGYVHDLTVTNGPAHPFYHSQEIVGTALPVRFNMGMYVDSQSYNFINAYFDDGLSQGTVDCSLYFDKMKGLSIEPRFSRLDFKSVKNQIAGLSFEGAGPVEGSLIGPYPDIKIRLPADMNHFVFEKMPFGRVATTVVYDNLILSMKDSEIMSQESIIQGDMDIDFRKDIALRISAESQRVRIEDLPLPLKGLPSELGFSLEMQTFIEGSQKWLPIGKLQMYADGGVLQASSHSSSLHPEQLNIHLNSQQFPVEYNQIKNKVTASLQAHVEVNEKGLHLMASSDMIRLYTLPIPFTQFFLELNADKDRLTIHRSQLNNRLGYVAVQGEVELSKTELPSFCDLSADIVNWSIDLPQLFESQVNGKLQLTGSFRRPVLSGDLELGHAKFKKDFDYQKSFLAHSVLRSTVSDPFLQKQTIELNVRLEMPEGLWLKNRQINGQWRGNLHLRGDVGRPYLVGTLSLMSGEAYFTSNRYRLSKARLDFNEDSQLLPYLNVEAETRVREHDITVRIEGEPHSPTVAFQSHPYLPEVDIASLLSLGLTTEEMSKNPQTASIAGLQLLGLYTNIGQQLKRILPEGIQIKGRDIFNDLQFTSIFSETDGNALPAIMLSFDIAESLKIKLQSSVLQNTREVFERKAEVELAITRPLRLRFSWSSEGESSLGDAGADIWYAWEF